MKYFTLPCIFLLLLNCSTRNSRYDVVIRNAKVIDGSNQPAYRAHVAIAGDTIAAIERGEKAPAGKRTVDAEGYVLCPGFIDPHTHTIRDLTDTAHSANLNYLLQGVTTVFAGNDGNSVFDIGKRLSRWENQGIGTNAALYIGHSTIRRKIMGMRNQEPTPEEMENMKKVVVKGMKEGAFGFSSGLYYAPASYSNTEEVIELVREVAAYGGHYDVHLRDESSYNIGLLAAVEETVRIARESGVHGHIAHLKCLGADVWGKSPEVIRIVEEARRQGITITADQYPYPASGSSIAGALMPRWALTDDPPPAEKLADPKFRKRIVAAMEENMRRRGGPATLLLTYPNDEHRKLKGQNLAQVAALWNMPPVEAAIEIFLHGGSSLGSFNMREDDITTFMRQPWVMTGSDGSGGHPRKYGTYAKKIREYVLQKNILTLEEMIERSTSLPARTFGIPKRGEIKVGYYADLILFKPEEIADRATFEDPTALAVGMTYVLVNGQIAIDRGTFTGTLAGRPLRKHK